MADPLADFLGPLSALGQAPQSSGMGIRTLPMSQNIEDRRAEPISLASLAQLASAYLGGGDGATGGPSTIFPGGPHSQDISDAAQREQFRTVLTGMGQSEEAKRKNDSWLRSIFTDEFKSRKF